MSHDGIYMSNMTVVVVLVVFRSRTFRAAVPDEQVELGSDAGSRGRTGKEYKMVFMFRT